MRKETVKIKFENLTTNEMFRETYPFLSFAGEGIDGRQGKRLSGCFPDKKIGRFFLNIIIGNDFFTRMFTIK